VEDPFHCCSLCDAIAVDKYAALEDFELIHIISIVIDDSLGKKIHLSLECCGELKIIIFLKYTGDVEFVGKGFEKAVSRYL